RDVTPARSRGTCKASQIQTAGRTGAPAAGLEVRAQSLSSPPPAAPAGRLRDLPAQSNPRVPVGSASRRSNPPLLLLPPAGFLISAHPPAKFNPPTESRASFRKRRLLLPCSPSLSEDAKLPADCRGEGSRLLLMFKKKKSKAISAGSPGRASRPRSLQDTPGEEEEEMGWI
ncbi:hypothetical protein DBR06_SOUSAS52010001, partial [Sousa chinensis]